MARYMLKVRYTTEGIAGVKREGGSARRDVAAKLCESVGGKLESFDFAFGDTDVYAIGDFPDATAAARAVLTVAASGGAHVETVALLTAEEMDAAAGGEATYRKPGG